jgi:hypothetical protein
LGRGAAHTPILVLPSLRRASAFGPSVLSHRTELERMRQIRSSARRLSVLPTVPGYTAWLILRLMSARHIFPYQVLRGHSGAFLWRVAPRDRRVAAAHERREARQLEQEIEALKALQP